MEIFIMYKLAAVGVDGVIHCCSVFNKEISCCESNMPIKQVNPNFSKLTNITWCYECSHLLDLEENYVK
ncbi:hypothetical protein S140_186 [Shewanella sp. phage 1/40]|uniref:hypothetical protein n=1 Tax=Shewanella sp. phage 1/40 TaxID=1458860 RepID=UPI0004F768C4|nr:hypothetical protein S140_186 [Shewanella sp. phage 1/40]AHK11593.1 hypothetical protein S140_186 [Shewanella sp. phage 1/40]